MPKPQPAGIMQIKRFSLVKEVCIESSDIRELHLSVLVGEGSAAMIKNKSVKGVAVIAEV